MQRVDQKLEIVRCAVTAGGRVKPGDLITPRRVKRVFRNRQELNMREAHLLHMVDQRAGYLPVAERLRHRFLPP